MRMEKEETEEIPRVKVIRGAEESRNRKEGFRAALLRVAIISLVIVSVIYYTIERKEAIGPILIILGFLPWLPLYLAGRGVGSTVADIIYGIIDTGVLGVMALIGASLAGILGAIVGAAAGDAITDGFAGTFEGKVAEYLRKHGIEEARTPLSASMGKMSGCLFGIGITLTIAWTVIGL